MYIIILHMSKQWTQQTIQFYCHLAKPILVIDSPCDAPIRNSREA
jgi:hypothetical protein